jgi:hypothetical protein
MAATSPQGVLIARVLERTGRPVEVVRRPETPGRAWLRLARGGAAAHFVHLGSDCGAQEDYWVCLQCLVILRVCAPPPAERADLGVNLEAQREFAKGMMAMEAYRGMPREPLAACAAETFTKMLLQLRSFPSELRASGALLAEFPGLERQQRVAVTEALRENSMCLLPEGRRLVPKAVREGGAAMNAAYALFWQERWAEQSLTLPYEAAGFLAAGRRLLGLLEAVPDQGGVEDRSLVDSWASALGVSSWYSWVPVPQEG